ncbi:helix-hairpin-helix domain-containing protein [Streptomyces sp. 8N616]|uniref:helix-hairpin-helix domain-containing protein n=1 Tax=Streptomyces sp. 8N616 TaxID=3457414 RepID=UPI003FD02811
MRAARHRAVARSGTAPGSVALRARAAALFAPPGGPGRDAAAGVGEADDEAFDAYDARRAYEAYGAYESPAVMQGAAAVRAPSPLLASPRPRAPGYGGGGSPPGSAEPDPERPAPPGGSPDAPSGGSGPDAPSGGSGPDASGSPPEDALPRRTRWRLAIRERLPLWMQLRCGVEPRTLAALAVVLVLAGGVAAYHFWTGRPQTVRAPAAEPPPGHSGGHAPASGAMAPSPSPGPAPGAPAAGGGAHRIVVDVAGKVRRPGIHELPAGSRVADALEAAGGVRPGTDTRALNRARILNDGEQIVVGVPPPAAAPGADAGAGGGGAGAASAAGAAGTPGAAGASSGAAAGPVSLNAATAEQLDALPGVGPVLAQHILDYREQNGGFTSVDQLREVNGIGDRRFAELRSLVQP